MKPFLILQLRPETDAADAEFASILARSGLDVQRLRIEMELNSLEAIKNAVQAGLGAAFVPVVSVERELAAGPIHRPIVADLQVRRQLKLITHPARYCSRASAAFRQDVLPVFASPDSPLRQGQPA